MVILQITKKVPFPFHDGEAWAVKAIANGMHDIGHKVHLLALNTTKHFADNEILKSFKTSSNYTSIQTINIDTNTSALRAISNLWESRSYHIDRYDQETVRQELEIKLKKIEKIDVVIFESLFVLPYYTTIRAREKQIKIIYRAHNVEHLIWQRISNEVSPLLKWYFRLQSKRLKRFEQAVLPKVDLVASVSDVDRSVLKNLSPKSNIGTIPIGIEFNCPVKDHVQSVPLKIGFIGSLDWRPNRLGLKHFIKHMFSSLKKHNIELHIAGRHSYTLSHQDKVIINHGEVESSAFFLKSIDISIVPLWSGSGTRIKILEAMSLGKPVVSTTIGAEGLNVSHLKNILIANNHDEWITAINLLRSKPSIRNNIINSAFEMLEENHNSVNIASTLIQKIKSI